METETLWPLHIHLFLFMFFADVSAFHFKEIQWNLHITLNSKPRRVEANLSSGMFNLIRGLHSGVNDALRPSSLFSTSKLKHWYLNGEIFSLAYFIFSVFLSPTALLPLLFLFLCPNSCCRCTQLQHSSLCHALQLLASLGNLTNRQVWRIKCTCADPNTHRHTHRFLGQMLARQAAQTSTGKKRLSFTQTLVGTRNYDSLNPEELNSKCQG